MCVGVCEPRNWAPAYSTSLKVGLETQQKKDPGLSDHDILNH